MEAYKKILNVGFPKVGNTWIGRTLSNALNAKFCEYDINGKLLADSTDKEVLSRICGNIFNEEKTIIEKIEKTHLLYHEWINRDENLKLLVVYITRDPRDVAISYFYYTYYNRPFVENGQVKKCNYLQRKYFILKTIFSYYIHKASWKFFIDETISYEDMWNNSYPVLRNLLEKLDISYNDNLLKDAINYHSWANLAKGRKPGDAINTSFLRYGNTGAYKKEFDILDHFLFYLISICAKTYIKINHLKRRFY